MPTEAPSFARDAHRTPTARRSIPSVIVLGGLLTRAGEHLIAGVREVVYTRSLPLATGSLQILPARTGRNAAIAGAAVMVTERVLGVRYRTLAFSS